MLLEARELQSEAVANLVSLTDEKDELTFKAPTGSGKTYMMADMMNRIIEQDGDIVFLVSSLSKGNLATQNYEKFLEYSDKGNFKTLKPHLISSQIAGEERLFIPIDYNVYLLPRDLYKKNGRLMQGAMENLLLKITGGKLANGLGKKVYLIKDECHIATNNLDNLSNTFFTKIYNFSATPKLARGQTPDVEIKNEDAVNAKLIKDVELIDDWDIKVGEAINKFEDIKENYRNLLGVNPCLIIQISNKEKADAELEEIWAELNKAEHMDLKWMLIVNEDKKCDTNDNFKAKKLPVSKWKDYAKENLSTIDIIIFKMVITEGWDIPRACMLYQVRDSKSKQLDEQVMGRVRRNPRLLDFETLSLEAQHLAMTAWVWGIVPVGMQKSIGVRLWDNGEDIRNEIMVKTTRLKTLANKSSFSITKFLDNKKTPTTTASIFKLYGDYTKVENSVREMCKDYATDYPKWFQAAENIGSVAKESSKYICDYESSMELVKNVSGEISKVSFPLTSHYIESDKYLNISDWVWKRNDGQKKFAFDSEAEKEWTEVLKELSIQENDIGIRTGEKICKGVAIGKTKSEGFDVDLFGNKATEHKDAPKQVYLWGKNYLQNSAIKFEYYFDGIHSSYPDFIMRDSYGRIHIFEVKSLNRSTQLTENIDNAKYEGKINELKKAYKQASKLTNQIFYLPIKEEDNWKIFQYKDGDVQTLTEQGFKDFCGEMLP